nr:MAG TPA: hypothetical protein [Caudoviricetes sp.]DAQ64319.1 MAG TPA: hypothetical protein [Caudoviricetes sp.]
MVKAVISVTAFSILNKQKTASISLRLKQLEQYFRKFPFYF